MSLSNVGLRVWQCAFVLTEFLIRQPPHGHWAGVKTLDLGSGTGVDPSRWSASTSNFLSGSPSTYPNRWTQGGLICQLRHLGHTDTRCRSSRRGHRDLPGHGGRRRRPHRYAAHHASHTAKRRPELRGGSSFNMRSRLADVLGEGVSPSVQRSEQPTGPSHALTGPPLQSVCWHTRHTRDGQRSTNSPFDPFSFSFSGAFEGPSLRERALLGRGCRRPGRQTGCHHSCWYVGQTEIAPRSSPDVA